MFPRIFAAALPIVGALLVSACNQPSLIAAKASNDYEAAIHADARGDKAGAFPLYLSAAQGGNMDAQFHAAWRYQNGDGVAQNYFAALEWYVKASSSGHSTASNNIGAMINNNRGLAREPARALAWYLRGTALGSAAAMDNIAAYYRNGLVIPRNAAKEYFWEALAVRFGHEAAKERMLRAAASLGGDQRRVADEAVRGYRSEHLQQLAADLLAAADIRDFVVAERAAWAPGSAPIQFQFPARLAWHIRGNDA